MGREHPDDWPTRAECERDEQNRRPYVPTPEQFAWARRTDPFNPENQSAQPKEGGK